MTTIAFLGTGTMGAPMARRLLGAGHQVRVWNRTRAKAQQLEASGAAVADSPGEAARGADVLITMLLDAESTVAAGSAAAAELADDAVWVQMGTIGVDGIGQVLAAAGGATVVDAPVLGTKGPAEQGNLVVLAAGPHSVRPRVQPLFDVLGNRTLWLGEDAARAAATRLKLAVNNWVLALNNAVGETIALARALGTDPQQFLEAIEGTGVDSPYAHLKGAAILNEDYAPSFSVSAASKDAQLISAAVGEDVRLDAAEAVRNRLQRAVHLGHGAKDMAAVYFASTGEAGKSQ
ncbi:3-hydroxyisobutyrate dehydrogenase [Saccharopolyspora rectivirgula]|jgi:3-hydroxyisobutyrate dehydrogenase|uniref:3-hydroxyisobutyrate dehydrogenase n=2 Tax=Saccharopolyspora rectivirgula TaxID=28042 RepID=A0A073B061_9PSEU|nr:3-hydroxyisobutyrate dehydrogenase [Saccharopolyspora rectivirgula]